MDDAELPRSGSREDLAVLAGLAALAFLIRLVPVLLGGGLRGLMTYDDGVYFGSAIALVHGRIPYRDFLLLHPPGVLYVLAPFAALGNVIGDSNAFAVARLAFMALGAANTVLVALVAGSIGRRAALVAGATYAVWEVAANVERTTWLIAPQNSLLLLALLALTWRTRGMGAVSSGPGTRRSAFAGAFLGLAFACQIWGIVPLTVVLGWIVLASRRTTGGWLRPLSAYLLAAAATAGLAWLPFLAVSGPPMIRYVVLDQLGRGTDLGPIGAHLRNIEGIPADSVIWHAAPDAGFVLAFLVTAVAIGWAAWQRPQIRLWASLLAVQAALLFLTPPFVHYAGWLAPAATLAIGGTVSTMSRRLSGSGWPSFALGVIVVLSLGIMLVTSTTHEVGTRLHVARLDGALDDARCVTADSPTLLIETDALRRALQAGCPLLLDPTGTSYDTDRGGPRSRNTQPEYQKAMAAYYGGSDAAMFVRLGHDAFQSSTRSAIQRQLPVLTKVGPVRVLTRARS